MVFAHELGHSIVAKLGAVLSRKYDEKSGWFSKWSVKKLRREIDNWDEFEKASREFRPEFWDDPKLGQQNYVRRADEKIADTIAMVLLGRTDPRVLLPIMNTIGMSPESLGLAPEAFEKVFITGFTPEPSIKLPGELTPEEAVSRVLKKLSIGGDDAKQPMDWKARFEKIYTRTVDNMYPFKKIVARLGIDYKKGEIDPYVLDRLSRGLNDKAKHFLEYGPFDPETLKPTGNIGLKEILVSVKEDIDLFRAFLAAARAVEYSERYLVSGIDLPAAKVVVDTYQAKFGDLAEKL